MNWLLVPLVTCSLARALPAYDRECARALHESVAHQTNHSLRESWDKVFRSSWGIDRVLEPVEFEALMDGTHRLGLTARLVMGPYLLVDDPSESRKLELGSMLGPSPVEHVHYLPSARDRLADLYRRAVKILPGRRTPGCYRTYLGPMEAGARPFAPREEWALKRATIWAVPHDDVAAAHKKSGSPKEDLAFILAHMQKARLLESNAIVFGVFDPAEASALVRDLVVPYLGRGFARLLELGTSG